MENGVVVPLLDLPALEKTPRGTLASKADYLRLLWGYVDGNFVGFHGKIYRHQIFEFKPHFCSEVKTSFSIHSTGTGLRVILKSKMQFWLLENGHGRQEETKNLTRVTTAHLSTPSWCIWVMWCLGTAFRALLV